MAYEKEEVTKMLGEAMDAFTTQMISLMRECADHPRYRDLSGKAALNQVADKLAAMKEENKNG